MTYVPGQLIPYIFFGTKPQAAIFQDCRLKSLWARKLMNRWFDCIQIWYGCSLGISDDLINFWDKASKIKMAAAAIKKMAA